MSIGKLKKPKKGSKVKNQTKINELELTLRTIDDILPDVSTAQLQKWQGILKTTIVKVEQELTNTCVHTCELCLLKEYGYRDELPISWYKKGESEICFQHDYKEAEKLLKEIGNETDSFLPPDVAPTSLGAVRTQMENLPPPASEEDKTIEELMDLL